MQLQVIQKRIHGIRGQKVMLDFDLAELYETETKYLKRAVKQNINRFPSDFMMELTKKEWDSLRCNLRRRRVPKRRPATTGIMRKL